MSKMASSLPREPDAGEDPGSKNQWNLQLIYSGRNINPGQKEEIK